MGSVRRYELLEKIGAGGMAEIHLADAHAPDGSVLRLVVKRIHPQFSEDVAYRVMFTDEARIAGALDHPNIVRVLDVGMMDNRLFIALEHIEGRDLQTLLRSLRASKKILSAGAALYVTAQVLRALDHAHNRVSPDGKALKLVHRDITPQNILLARDGAVKVTDFGLAKAAIRMGQTVAGVIKGNVRYMAPEQISGKPLDARVDIYATGMLLFTLLCGKHPFEDEPLLKAMNRTTAGNVPLPSAINPAVSPALEGIVMQATALEPHRRFPTAAEFLRAVENGATPEALKAGREEIALSVRTEDTPPPQPVSKGVSHSIIARIDKLIADATGDGDSVFRTSLSDSQKRAALAGDAGPKPRVLGGHSEAITALVALPDGKRLVTTSHDHSVRVWSLATGREERSLAGHRSPVTCCAVSGDGTTIASGGRDHRVRLWDAVRGTALQVLEGHGTAVTAVALSNNGTVVLTGGSDRTARIWDAASLKMRVSFTHRDTVSAVAFTPDGRTALTGCDDGIVRVWDIESGELRRSFQSESETDSVVAMAVSADGALVASGGGDSVIRVWDFGSGAELRTLVGHSGAVSGLALSADLKTLVSSSFDCSIRVWNVEQGLEERRIKTSGPVGGVVLAADQSWIAGAVDRAVTLFPR